MGTKKKQKKKKKIEERRAERRAAKRRIAEGATPLEAEAPKPLSRGQRQRQKKREQKAAAEEKAQNKAHFEAKSGKARDLKAAEMILKNAQNSEAGACSGRSWKSRRRAKA